MLRKCQRSCIQWPAVLFFYFVAVVLVIRRHNQTDVDETTHRNFRDGVGSVDVCRPDMNTSLLPVMPERADAMLAALFNYLTAPHPAACHKLARLGGAPLLWRGRPVMDGYKYVCFDPETQLLQAEKCLVYSFGVSEDWSFDWDMEALGCDIFAFDPSIDLETGRQGGRVTFFRVGLGTNNTVTTEGWRLYTLDALVKRLDHNRRPIDYLKIDIEGGEWRFLELATTRSNSTLMTQVQQIGLELHLFGRLPFADHVDQYRSLYQSLMRLQNHGFYLVSYDPNAIMQRFYQIEGVPNGIPSAFEIVLLKSQCYTPL